jgi:hypothetical protein
MAAAAQQPFADSSARDADGMRAMMVETSAVLEKPYTVDQLQTALSVHFRIPPRSGR